MYNHGALPCAFMLGSVWLASLVTSEPSHPATDMQDPALALPNGVLHVNEV